MSSFFGFGMNGSDRSHFRFTSATNGTLKKTQFYVWFLGSKQSQGLRGREYVLPTVRELIEEGGRHPPPCKVTVQISEKGMKIIQSVPSLSHRTGKLKMEVMKLVVPPHSITYSLLGPHPYTDVVSCILLLWNPETRCPVHTHVYRCDSSETASIMHSALQMLIDKAENQRALMDVERRLMARGLLIMKDFGNQIERRPPTRHQEAVISHRATSMPALDDTRCLYELPGNFEVEDVPNTRLSFPTAEHGGNGFCNRTSRPAIPACHMNPIADRDKSADRVSRLHQAVFSELKEKLQSKGPLLLPPKDYTLRFVKTGLSPHVLSTVWPTPQRPPLHSRLFNNTKINCKIPLQFDRLGKNRLSYDEPVNTDLSQVPARKYRNAPRDTSPASTLQGCEEPSDSGKKLRMFGDTIRLKIGLSKDDNPGRNGLRRHYEYGRLAASTCNLAAPKETKNGIAFDDNWLITRPRFTSVQNLNCGQNDQKDKKGQDRVADSRTASRSGSSNGNNVGSSSANSSYSSPQEAFRQKRLRRQPNPPLVCDPFGRKYERRTTVKNFWKNVQLPTKIEDNYGLWFLAPNEHYFP